MKQLGLLFLFSLLLSCELQAQISKTIVSDRPGFTNSPFVVGPGVVQFQLGGSYIFSESTTGVDSASDDYLGEGQLRIGLTENLEFLGALGFAKNRTLIDDNAKEISGITDLDLGLRMNLYKNEGWAPSVALLTMLKMNKYDGDYGIDHFAPKLALLFTKQASDWLSLSTNVGMEWDGLGNPPTTFYTLNASFTVSDKIGLFLENYGTMQNENPNANWDAGLMYLVGDNLQLDLSGGFSRNNGLDQFLVSAGASFRLGKPLKSIR